MIEQELERKLTNRVNRANRIIKGSLIGILVIVMLTLILIVFQLIFIQKQQDDNLLALRESAAANHERTQKYVKCVAEALTQPISERNELDLDTCTSKANTDTKKADVKQVESTQPKPSNDTTTQNTSTTNDEEPVADDGFQLHDLPLIGGLLNGIGL